MPSTASLPPHPQDVDEITSPPCRPPCPRLLRAPVSGHAAAAPPSSEMNSRRFMCGWPPPGKRSFGVQRRGRLQSCVRPVGAVRVDCWPGWGPRTESSSLERDRCPDEAPGLARLRRIDRLCHHASLLSRKLQNVAQRPKPPPRAGSSHAGASPPRRCARSCWLALPPPPGSADDDAVRSPTDRHWSPSSVAN